MERQRDATLHGRITTTVERLALIQPPRRTPENFAIVDGSVLDDGDWKLLLRVVMASGIPKVGLVHPVVGTELSFRNSDASCRNPAFHFLPVVLVNSAALLFVKIEGETFHLGLQSRRLK